MLLLFLGVVAAGYAFASSGTIVEALVINSTETLAWSYNVPGYVYSSESRDGTAYLIGSAYIGTAGGEGGQQVIVGSILKVDSTGDLRTWYMNVSEESVTTEIKSMAVTEGGRIALAGKYYNGTYGGVRSGDQ